MSRNDTRRRASFAAVRRRIMCHISVKEYCELLMESAGVSTLDDFRGLSEGHRELITDLLAISWKRAAPPEECHNVDETAYLTDKEKDRFLTRLRDLEHARGVAI